MKALRLAQRIKQAPTTPGVYRWYGQRGKLLYVGKAANLRSRLSSYPKTTNDRIRMMVEEATTLDWKPTPTDIEALILESALVKQHRPKYNIALRDDKNYFLVAVTKEEFPQIILTHQVQSHRIKRPIGEHIGPFTEGVPIKTTLRVLRGLFPYCTCKQKHHLRCLNAHIGKCPGYCCLKTPANAAQKKEYRGHIRAIREILTGKRATVIRRLEREMKARGNRGQLEEAHDLQRIIERIKRVFQNAQINAQRELLTAHAGGIEALRAELGLDGALHRIEGYDVANIQQATASGAMVVFTNGRPEKAEYRLFNIPSGIVGDVPQLANMFARRLAHRDWPRPDLLVVDGAKGQLNAAVKALKIARLAIPVLAITKNDRHQAEYMIPSTDNRARPLAALPRAARDLLVHIDSEAHRFSITHHRRRHRRQVGM